MTALKITSVGNSAGVLLPKELLTKLRVDKGDVLHVIETENGIELTPYDPEFDAQMADAINIHAQQGLVETVRLNGRRFDCGSVDGFMRASNHEYEKRLVI